MSELILEMKDVTKHFPGVIALDSAHIEVNKGEVHILVGENGAGKSTLVKILAGAYTKDSGNIIYKGKIINNLTPKYAQKLGLSIIYQEFNLVPFITVAENIFLGREIFSEKIPGKMNWKKLYKEAQKILDDLHVDINAKTMVKDLGIAQQQMVEVAKALSMDSNIIIMDEPTASLTTKEIENLFEIIKKVKSKGVSIIYISHRMEEFEQIGDRVTIMRDGKTIKTLNICDTNTDELIKLMVGRELKDKFPKLQVDKGNEALRILGFTRKNAFNDINLNINEGEIVALSGLMGAGRTELARAIYGLDPISKGDIFINKIKIQIKSPKDAISSGIGFVTEDRKSQGLVLTMGVGNNITLASISKFIRGIHINLKQEEQTVREYISKLNIKTYSSYQKVINLSGGNQQKVVIAKWLLTKSKIFIFDEPTRGIDVGAKIEVYNLINELAKGGAAILLISSEMPEVLGMSDRIFVMCRGEVTAELDTKEATQEKILFYATGGGKYNA